MTEEYFNGVRKIKEYLVKEKNLDDSHELELWFKYDFAMIKPFRIVGFLNSLVDEKLRIHALINPEVLNNEEWYKDFIKALEEFYYQGYGGNKNDT